MNSVPAFSPPRVAANLRHAFGGIWRLTFRRFLAPGHWLTLAVGLAVLLLLCAGGPRGGGSERFLDWTISFYLTFLVPALAFMAGAGAIRDEMKSGTVDYVLTRPVPRPAFVVFKYVAHLGCTQIDFLFSFGVMLVFPVLARDYQFLGATACKLLLCQFLLVAAFSGLGFLCGAITSRYVVIGLAYAGLIEAGAGQIPTQISRLSMTHQVRDLLRPLWDKTVELAAAPGWFATMTTLLVFSALTLVATAAIFALRELSGPSDS
jgi:ABC-2 type transport system permease protein